MNDLTTLARVKAIVADEMGFAAHDIADDMRFVDYRSVPQKEGPDGGFMGGGFDSLELLALGIAIQEHFGLEIPDADLDKPEMGTPAGIAAYIDARSAAVLVDTTTTVDVDGPAPAKQPWVRPAVRRITDPEEIKKFDAARVADDVERFGIGIYHGGQRVDPKDFYLTPPDYEAMSAGEMLAALGTDAAKWAEAFIQHNAGKRITLRENTDCVSHGDMIGWFANAIEAARPLPVPEKADGE